MSVTPRDYARHFTPGHTFTDETGLVGTVDVRSAGELPLPSGRVVACDPFVQLGTGECAPFTVTVEPGRYRVEAAVATLTDPGEPDPDVPHLRLAAARLVIRDEPAVSWEPALQPDDDPAHLADDEFFGYNVDCGTGCFYDAASDDAFPEFQGDEGPLWDAFEREASDPGPFLVASPSTGHTVAAFTSGWGDGGYPTWIGRTATGAVACFVTDFFVIEDPDGA